MPFMPIPRYFLQRILPFLLLFLGAETLMRTVFLIKEWQYLNGAVDAVKIMATGLVFDLAAGVYALIPLALYLLVLPKKLHESRPDRIISAMLYGMFGAFLIFTCIGEWFFWDEFTARFNFIAVDYLVYTHEVIGNIRESYPVAPLFAAITVVAVIVGWLYARRLLPVQQPYVLHRLATLAICVGLAALSFVGVQGRWVEIGSNRYQYEVAKNGMYELFSAYRNNQLDYHQFYVTQDQDKLLAHVRHEIDPNSAHFLDDKLTHRVEAPAKEQRRNIVMITVESLSGNYLRAFGNQENLTPHLDALADQSLFFTNFYATGTRTVYGLSSLTLSMPPIPGNSIVRRPQNENLFSLGSVLNAKGYVSKFIYGGYGYFDNMNYFFEHNGYEIVDRTMMGKDEITFGNIWGVADEDLLRRTLKENDKAYAEGKPFFAMVMTTSNHRPFTYPDGRIDIPSHTGRKGGVKYTDYTIHQFLEEARSRPWFNNTVFVIVADHTAGGAGKSELDPAAYHIPLLIYAPGFITPQKVNTLSSQIDVAPTRLSLLNMSYDSRFYGKDILSNPPHRALISNYQQLGYLTNDNLLMLKPIKQMQWFKREGNDFILQQEMDAGLATMALSYFQTAPHWKEWSGMLKQWGSTNQVESKVLQNPKCRNVRYACIY
jgi:phosphoglycerol transferase MdoB-like AlkP superfamily enzyme